MLTSFRLGALVCLLTASLSGQSNIDEWLAPAWKSGRITADPLFFIQEGTNRPSAKLMWQPTQSPELRSADGQRAYETGKDFVWKLGGRVIELPPGSAIPFKTLEQLYPTNQSPNSIGPARNRPGRSLLFGEGHFFHNQQIMARYDSVENWTGWRPAAKPARLPKTIARLQRKESLKVVVLGDSISTGANASGAVNAAPFQPGYPGLVAEGLKRLGSTNVNLVNLSVGGQATPWAITRVAAVVQEKPNLVIIAFGMNDVAGIPVGQYIANTLRVIAEIRLSLPDSEFVLVSSMLGNPEWTLLKSEMFPLFREGLERLESPGVALADVTRFWTDLLKRKGFYDLTGNGVNHPNDFGHRVYAHVILSLF